MKLTDSKSRESILWPFPTAALLPKGDCNFPTVTQLPALVHHQLMQLHSLAWTKLPLLCHGLRALQLCPAPAGLALVTVGTP